jgi:hypothetical protein
LFAHSQNFRQHLRQIIQNIVIGDMQNMQAQLREGFIALSIVFLLLLVNLTLYLNDQARRMTIEIHNESGNDLLPAKV